MFLETVLKSTEIRISRDLFCPGGGTTYTPFPSIPFHSLPFFRRTFPFRFASFSFINKNLASKGTEQALYVLNHLEINIEKRINVTFEISLGISLNRDAFLPFFNFILDSYVYISKREKRFHPLEILPLFSRSIIVFLLDWRYTNALPSINI